MNIIPLEIEDHINKHPNVFDSYVIGVEDTFMGEEVCAWVRLKEKNLTSASGILEHCKDAIANYKLPRYIRFVDAYPLTSTGKISKRHMKEITA